MNPKTKKNLLYVLVVALILFSAGYYLFKKNIGTVNIPGKTNLAEQDAGMGEPVPYFRVPDGFKISIYARGIPGARALELDPNGRLLVSETGEGKIAVIENGAAKTLISKLSKPHGLAMNCGEDGKCFLYVAEQGELSRFPYDEKTPSLGAQEKLMPINSSSLDRHFTRSLLFLPPPSGDTLLISVGSSCNVCNEKEPDYAEILFYNIKTKEYGVYAKGLRNAVFMTLNPVDGRVFATEMGRDNLGDNIPPDEINVIEKGKNYGWPYCYGKNIHDGEFDSKGLQNCSATVPSFADLQAHSAPLGLAFIPEEGWPEDYWYNLLVAYHGSWNRSTPTGYKIVRIKMNAKGEYEGTEDFITGWLTKDGKKSGRPVDIKVFPGGTAFISDDSAGVIYKLTRKQ